MKKRHYLFSLLLLFSLQMVFTQENFRKGVHELQMEEFGSKKALMGKQEAGKEENIMSLQQHQASTLNKIVFGFLPYWERSASAHDNIQYDKLSHLACFNFLVQLDASVATPSGWPWTTEINAAHAAGTKVLMTVTNFGGTDDANAVAEELITNTSKQNTFFANIKSIIQAANLDGVNIDFEAMISTTRDTDLNTFIAALTSYIHTELPGKEVSFDSPAVNWGGWDFNGLVNSVDYLVIMAYDYTSASSTKSGPVAPLIHPVSWGKSVTYTLENSGTGYAGPVANSPEKLVLAVPYYGQHWETTSSTAEATTTSHVSSTRFRDTEAEALTHGGWIWNADYEYPWYRWNDGSNWNQVWSDNLESIEDKYDLALAKNLGGVGMWALNYDGTRTEFWDLIESKFSATASVDYFLKNNITIYPNPSNGIINISSVTNIELNRIEIFNVLGQAVMKVQPESKSLDICHLRNGTYFLKMEDNRGNKSVYKVLKSE